MTMRIVFSKDHDGYKRGQDCFVERTLARRFCREEIAVPYAKSEAAKKEAEEREKVRQKELKKAADAEAKAKAEEEKKAADEKAKADKKAADEKKKAELLDGKKTGGKKETAVKK